ncbi:tripartite motif-containing protein 5-like [Haliotis rubra]|uniref:tripartite motif-containing protein 5-like n=1 Tax=Haliotis rubra TaxID=36100 RepID=UPI001EE57862|nr:tripartite motif-containing protein 5-like [Haliotis rubra]
MADVFSKLREQVTCTICHDYFDTPKLLPCLHRFCETCLADYIKTKHVTTQLGLPCPQCRRLCKPKGWTHTMTKETWADKFQTDFVIASMCEELRGSVDACSNHPDQQVQAYCSDCGLCVCYACATVKHRRCERVAPLTEAADSTRYSCERRLESLQDKIREAEERLGLITEEQMSLKQAHEFSAKSIVKDFIKVRNLIDEGERKLYARIEMEFTKAHQQLDRKERLERKDITDGTSVEKELTELIDVRSDAVLMETFQQRAPKRSLLEDFSNEAIIPGTYLNQTKAKIARLDETGKDILNTLSTVLSQT